MKVIKIFSLLALVVALGLARQAKAEANYDACANLNDYLSYSKCVAEIDSKNNGTPVVLPADLKSQDGAFSLVIDGSGGQTASRYVILNLTASTSTAKIAIAKDSNFGFAARQTFANKVWWRLEDTPNETQYIYVKFFNEAGDSLVTVGGAVKYVPRAVDKTKETWAKNNFLKLFKRSLDSKKSADSAWLEIAAYGLNEATPKDEAKEKTALNKFIAIFKRVPAGDDWSLVHAMAYSQDLADLAVVKSAVSTTDTAVVVAETVANDDNCRAKQTFKTVMDVGSKGAEVQALQEFFKCLGLLDTEFKVSGTFDNDTEEAGKKFQEQHGLKCSTGAACGRVGPATAKKLNEVSAAAKAAAAAIVAATPASDTAVAAILKLKTNLTVGSKGAEVTALQKFLAQDAEIYPEGKVTGTFGPLTEAAVKRFQAKHELSCKDGTACGYVGAATRQKIEEVSAQ
jgi:peptidoglycan hydrolase-like protein with peptidoglycan-binding domain